MTLKSNFDINGRKPTIDMLWSNLAPQYVYEVHKQQYSDLISWRASRSPERISRPAYAMLAVLAFSFGGQPSPSAPLRAKAGSGGGTRTPDTWIMIPLL
jgi:hypothetical protein